MIFLSISPANPPLSRRSVASEDGSAEVLHKGRHLLRPLDLFQVRQDHQAVAREQRLVAKAQHHVRHAAVPGVEPGDLRASPRCRDALLDLFHERGLLSLLGTEEQVCGGLTRRCRGTHV